MSEICSICQGDLTSDIYTLPECNHKFHTNCIIHWFRAGKNKCPLCMNQGINYQQAEQYINEANYVSRKIWENYYNTAVRYSKRKDADKEISKKVKSIQKTMEEFKNKKKEYNEWLNQVSDGQLTNKEIIAKGRKVRSINSWKIPHEISKRKTIVGYMYYHKFLKNKIIIAEKINI